MAEYINRAELISNLKEFANEQLTTLIENLIQKQPTADVVEVRHGKWLNNYKSGTLVNEGFVSSCCDMWNERKSSFCPNCGAKMDGGNNE